MFRKRSMDLRRGTITVMAAVLTILLVGMVAFCVDIGYVLTAKEELQRTADATALATCWEYGKQLAEGNSVWDAQLAGRVEAAQYANGNAVTNNPMNIDMNTANHPCGDIVFGNISDLEGNGSALNTTNPNNYNAVQVRVRKTSAMNGEVPYYFARVFGMTGQLLEAEATAAIVRNVKGFRIPSDGGNVELLPFALDIDTWNDMTDGNAPDEWSWDASTKQVSAGCDGILEVNLYPQGTGSPGNRGTVDIGSSNNSTCDIARQILYGVSPEDLEHHGGELKFNHCGKLYLNGDTGISAGMKDELAAIVGQPRVIPIFSNVEGPGNNAEYTIVKWWGIRILDVKLTGPMSKKHVTVQAAPVVLTGVIPSESSSTSDYVYSPVVLVR